MRLLLQINRVGGLEERMQITVTDGGVCVLHCEVTLAEMMLAITGQAIVVTKGRVGK